MSKFISTLLAVLFSFALFVGMTFLIKPKAFEMPQGPEGAEVTFLYQEKDDEIERIKYPMPKDPEKPEPPKITTEVIESDPTPDRVAILDIEMPTAFDPNSKGFKAPRLAGASSGGAPGPRVRIDPNYPRDAAIKGIEGYVSLTFDISAMGMTENIAVIDANPRGVFERAARKALRKWRYEPKMLGDKAMPQPGQRITLEFHLESDLL